MDFGVYKTNIRPALPWLYATVALVVLTVCLVMLFSQIGSAFFPAYRYFSKTLMGGLATLCSVAPFSVWTWGLVVLAGCGIATFVYCIVQHRNIIKWFCIWLFVVASMGCFAVDGWALNHYAPPLSEDLGLTVSEYTEDELYRSASYYYKKACETATEVPRNEDGSLQRQDFEELAQIAGKSYAELGTRYEVFNGVTVPVKEMSFGGNWLLSLGSDGIFWPLTGEANVPSGVARATEAFNMCHEAAHRLGIAGEDEANFAAYLACESGSDSRFRYSGYYRAFMACYNALAEHYPNRLSELLNEAVENGYKEGALLLINDINETATTYEAYEGPVSEAGEATNDTYLKLFNEESGVKSYGEVVDYLIAWYLTKNFD